MFGKLSPYFIEIVKDACIKSFWRKKTLRTFLIQNNISQSALSSWAQDETKRDFLDRLFDQLISQKDNTGHNVIYLMARNLEAQNSFPDLQNWEDSKDKIRLATDAVNLLKKEMANLNDQIEDKKSQKLRREKSEKRRLENISSQKTLENLKSCLDNLANNIGTQRAGYEFQDWFYDFVDHFELECKRPYIVKGRQIDGSLTIDGTTFLVELKFTKEPIPPSDIDIFRQKIISKADNTMGIFISMSGFNPGAKIAASGERTPVLLLDYNHLYYVLGHIMTLGELVNRVKRHSAQTSEAYLSIQDFGK